MVRRLSSARAWVRGLALAFIAAAAAYPSEPSRMTQLVNNPNLSYSTFWGGNGYDAANAIAVDAAGNVYVTGQTNSVDFPATNRALPAGGPSCGSSVDGLPCFDVFVTKFSSTGSVIYSVYFGGSEDDRGTGIVVDSAGSAYVTGITNSTDFPTANPFQADLAGGNCGASASPAHCYDAFVTKLSPDGSSIIYSTYLGGSGQDLAAGIALDRLGEATVAGSTSSPNFPTSLGALQGAYAGGTLDAFVTRLDLAGTNVVYSTYLGGSGEDRGLGIAVNAAGEAIVAGSTASNNFPAVKAIQMRNAAGSCGSPTSPTACTDAFVTRLGAAGTSILYSTYLGGTGGDTANAIALDSVGAVYVAGSTTSINFPTTKASLQTTGGGVSVDAFVSKLVPDGSPLVFSSYLGGIGQEAAYAIAADSAGNALVTGYANDAAFPAVNPISNAGGKFNDIFVSKLNAAGSALIFSSMLGGSGYEAGQGIAVDADGNAFVAGWTFSEDFPTASAVLPSYAGGSYDAFVARLNGMRLPAVQLSETAIAFPAQGIGTGSSFKKVSLSNAGDGALNVTTVSVSGAFTVSDDCPASLVPGAACTLSIASNPEELGPQWGMVTIADNAWGSPHCITLSGNGIPSPVASFSPGNLTFEAQPVGQTSPPKLLMLANPGSVTLEVASIQAAGDFSQTNNCGSAVLAGEYCVLQVTFSPISAGTTSGQIRVTDNAPGSPQTVLLTGVGTGPAASLTPVSLTFGNQAVGTTSAPQTVSLTSTGAVALTVSSIAASGDFAVNHNCPRSLAPGAVCSIQVTFTPTARGLRSGSVVVTDNAASSPQTVPLSGLVVTPVAGLSRSIVNFGDQGVSTGSAPQAVILSNSGTDPLSVSRIVISGDFRQTNDCIAQLAPGESCEIQVVFFPAGKGARTGTLTLTDDALDSPQTVALEGNGVTAFSLQAAPDQATVVVGTPTASFTVIAGSAYAYPRAISLACDHGAPVECAFQPAIIMPGNSSLLTVGDLSNSSSGIVSLQVSGTSESQSVNIPLTVQIADFALSVESPSATVRAGRFATFSLAVQAMNGFNQTISLDCSGAPPLSTCQVVPSSVTPGSAQARVVVTTTAPASEVPWIGRPNQVTPPLASWRVAALCLLVLTGFLVSVRVQRKFRHRFAWASAGLFLLLLTSCGGGGQAPIVHHPGTPTGRYDLKISGTSAQLVRAITVTLQVD